MNKSHPMNKHDIMPPRDAGPNRPSWMRLCAWSAFFATLPSGVWRVLMIVGFMPGTADFRTFQLAGEPTLGYVYVFGLSIAQVTCGYLAVGLIRPWGEHLGQWRIPARLPVFLGAVGSLALIWIFNVQMVAQVALGHRPDAGLIHNWALAVMLWCYLPILLWGPLTLATVWGYWRCRAHENSETYPRGETSSP